MERWKWEFWKLLPNIFCQWPFWWNDPGEGGERRWKELSKQIYHLNRDIAELGTLSFSLVEKERFQMLLKTWRMNLLRKTHADAYIQNFPYNIRGRGIPIAISVPLLTPHHIHHCLSSLYHIVSSFPPNNFFFNHSFHNYVWIYVPVYCLKAPRNSSMRHQTMG